MQTAVIEFQKSGFCYVDSNIFPLHFFESAGTITTLYNKTGKNQSLKKIYQELTTNIYH